MDYVKLARPRQWLKNLLVFAPLFFARELFEPEKLASALAAFAAFSLAASAVYVFNDIADREQDALHPEKRRRPVASGAVSRGAAAAFGLALALASAAVVALFVPAIGPYLALYAVLNGLYTARLKHVPVIDILVIAFFYFLRVEVGGVATSTPISGWLVLCVIFLSLFIIIAKRKAEYSRESRRPVLEEYTESFLDHLLTISASFTLVSYGIYTVLGPVPPAAVYSNFIVMFAVFRYLHIVYTTSRSEEPERLIGDPAILGSVAVWLVYMYGAFYYVTI